MEFEFTADVTGSCPPADATCRLTPGQRYRVTVTPADAPKPEPVAYGLARGGKLVTAYAGATSREDYPPNLKVVPLYEHPPTAEIETLRERLAATERELERWKSGTQVEGDYVPEGEPNEGGYGNCSPFAGQLRSIDVDADVDEAMRELEKQENQP